MNLLTASDIAARFDALPRTAPAIQLEGVSVRYRLPHERIVSFKEFAIRWLQRRVTYTDVWALHGVSLEVQRGETVGIIGPNGAGKSTLLKVIARVLHPSVGRAVVRGRVAPLLELGAGFDYELTGRENIALNGAILGQSRREMEAKLPRIAAFAEIGDFLDAPLRTYSTGMVARLGFAVATDVNPDILIVDEVLAVGDESFQRKCLARFESFRQAGITILVVSHNLALIRKLCDRVAWIDRGELRTVGAAGEVASGYQRFVT